MASLALGIAGAAVGSFFGPLGASIGWGLGAALGGALFAKGQSGPRITDLRAQNSAYGQPIPIGYGTIRIAGNVIWAADLVEHKSKSGGKGGPKITSYSYTQSFAVGLLETSFLQGDALINNPIVGILRIWADGRLIYGEGSDGAALPMTIYYGTEDQEADPTMEAEEGAGNVSAHRGMAYVVFNALPLGGFGNRMPNLTFEVVASGAMGLEPYAIWPVDYDFPINGSAYSYPFTLNGAENTADGLVLHRYRSGEDYGAEMGTSDSNIVYYDRSLYTLKGTQLSTETQVSVAFDTAHAHVLGSMNSDVAYAYFQTQRNCGSGIESFNTYAWLKAGVVTYTPPDLCGRGIHELAQPIEGSPIYWNGNVYAAGKYTGGDTYIRRWPAPDGAVHADIFELVGINADSYRTGYPASLGYVADAGKIVIGDDGYLYWLVGYLGGGGDGERLFKLDAELNLITSWWSGDGVPLPPEAGSFAIFRGHFLGQYNAGVFDIGHANYILYRMDGGTFTWVDELQLLSSLAGPVIYIGGGLAAVRGGILRLGTSGITLGEIVANVSQHDGFADTEYDVAQLTDEVRGYTVSNRMTGRAAIEALQPGYQFGAVESNLTAKFVKWAGEIVATVTADDLGARDDSSEPVDPITITHAQEKDLPQRIEAVFLNLDMDYQEGTQYAARTASSSDLHVAVNLPIVLVDAEAKAMADMLLFNAWIERDKFSFSLPRKWAHLEPTDIIDLDGHAVRITNKDEQGYTHIKFEGLATHTGVFVTAPVPAPPIGFVPQIPPSLNRTDLLLFDSPLITDTDFANGFYAAIAGRMAGSWPGMGLFKSIDGGVNYDSIYSTVEQDTFGVATTALGDWAGGNVFDEINSVTVRLTPGSGELSSSNALGVLNGANIAMLGDEIIQFKNATLIAERTYTLTGLLRGRRGTEWAIPDHGYDEDFVLLPCHNIEGAFAELGKERLYKGVTSGGLLSSATAVPFTNNGIALKCYAPCHLGGGRNAAGDIIINWTRRTRIGGAWLDNIDVPLSELTEQYTLVIFTDGTRATVKIAFAVDNAQTYTYTAAAQTTDFGSPQSTLYWNVAQNGVYGEGYEAEATT